MPTLNVSDESMEAIKAIRNSEQYDLSKRQVADRAISDLCEKVTGKTPKELNGEESIDN